MANEPLPVSGRADLQVVEFDAFGPMGSVVCRVTDALLIEVDALLPGRFISMAWVPGALIVADGRGFDELFAHLVREPGTRHSVWAACLMLAASDALASNRTSGAHVGGSSANVLRSGSVELLVVGRDDLDLPSGVLAEDPVVEVLSEDLVLRVFVRTLGGHPSPRLWARIHRGRERLFIALLCRSGPMMSAELFVPSLGSQLTIDVVDDPSLPAPIDTTAPVRQAIETARAAAAATAAVRDRSDEVPREEMWARVADQWFDASNAWYSLAGAGQAAIAAGLATRAAANARAGVTEQQTRSLRERACRTAPSSLLTWATESGIAALAGDSDRGGGAVASPLLDPGLRRVLASLGVASPLAPSGHLAMGLVRLQAAADAATVDAVSRRFTDLALRGWKVLMRELRETEVAPIL
jgi:hypothetical protein